LEAADDVSQGATKGNSGIVHSGYDDTPHTNRSKYCWSGNQMFPQLDRELRFGYQMNGSLVLATNDAEKEILKGLVARGEINGVKHMKILNREELMALEPNVNPKAVAALHSPSAGNVIPYEYAIAMCENAADNGVEIRVRREVTAISKDDKDLFQITARHWEPKEYIDAQGTESGPLKPYQYVLSRLLLAILGTGAYAVLEGKDTRTQAAIGTGMVILVSTLVYLYFTYMKSTPKIVSMNETAEVVVKRSSPPVGTNSGANGGKVAVEDMFTGGSGSWNAVNGKTFKEEKITARYIVNAAGGASDKIANMIGDKSFVIQPRLGDYLLLNRNQGHLTTHTLFPCPDPVLGKGVLVQTTLWGNLILGPTARDTYKPEARDMSNATIQEYILSKCKELVPYFDAKETIHAFCGARAKNSRGDWIIEASPMDTQFIHAAGIDSPGLAGSPAIALEIVRLLQGAGLQTPVNPAFNPNRAPIITPKQGMKGLKMGALGKNDSHGAADVDDQKRMESNVVCKCEKVTEAEIVRAVRRSLPIDSTQAIRKRTRAGMGHCQAEETNYNCECRVKAIIARENRTSVEEVGGRPWPATSSLTQRWIDDDEKAQLEERSQK
jgi:L-2-hydroxyglutarate oxidase LhgO